MNVNRNWVIAVGAVALIAAGAGYFLGRAQKNTAAQTVSAPTMTAANPETRIPIYYQDPDDKPDYSPTPKKTADGRDYKPVYDEATASATPSGPQGKGKILYYRNPMGLPDTSPTPKKDSMGMDYIAVYADEAVDTDGVVKISPERIQKFGVRTEKVSLRPITKMVRAVGQITVDERRMYVVSPRFEGWITKLYVNTTGATVKKGDPLFATYSPDVALAQQQYSIAKQSSDAMSHGGDLGQSNGKSMLNAASARLHNLGISNSQTQTGQLQQAAVLRAPIDGVVLEKNALEGMHFASGDTLFRIADLSTVWVIANMFEQDLASAHVGDPAKIVVAAYPGKSFSGKITFIYPTTDPTTRTTKMRVELVNSELLLKQDMYATVEVTSSANTAAVVAIPTSAVLDQGTQQVVLIDLGNGRFEPRPVKLGRRASDGYVEVLNGVAQGDTVVIEANFLIDSESNLRAALQNFAKPAVEAKQP